LGYEPLQFTVMLDANYFGRCSPLAEKIYISVLRASSVLGPPLLN